MKNKNEKIKGKNNTDPDMYVEFCIFFTFSVSFSLSRNYTHSKYETQHNIAMNNLFYTFFRLFSIFWRLFFFYIFLNEWLVS